MTKCNGCEIVKMTDLGKDFIPKGSTIIKMQGGWILNHSSEPQKNYLGHLILQPTRHVMDIDKLYDEEASALGTNLRNVIRALKEYWKQAFKWDELQRVYVVYFWESEFTEKPSKWHMHIHLFPRTKAMVGGHPPTEVAAWQMPELTEKAYFPSKYRIRIDNMKALFDYLANDLASNDNK